MWRIVNVRDGWWQAVVVIEVNNKTDADGVNENDVVWVLSLLV
jgi:hypothetical protein